MRKLIIAIDGPAASGKTTTAKLIAQKLGYFHVDTGAMYRAMALKVLERGLKIDQVDAISEVAGNTQIRFDYGAAPPRILLDGRDITDKIRTREVSAASSAVSAIKAVREVMVREQRKIGEQGGIVLEGRDIGTVVFPDADLKIFMVAAVDERARRRQREMAAKNATVDLDTLQNEIIQRDTQDSHREISPLRRADDAILLDTSNLTIEQQVDFVIHLAMEKLKVLQ